MPIEAIEHEDKRVNIPPAEAAELVDEEKSKTVQLRWERDPSLDPQLVWKGKDETDAGDLIVDAPPIFIQEKIDPRVLVENLRSAAERPQEEPELALFGTAEFDGLTGWDAIEYYEHEANWSNRMILGDSLQVMASLAEKENLRGKVQMIYIDPPYGIKFGSNWQASTGKPKVKDGKASDATREVEQIKAFRDTWMDGIHSYLAYLRDRLMVAHDLLADSGSTFVQIGDENVHLVRSVLDEVFGSENFISIITIRKTTGGDFTHIPGTVDFVLMYAKSAANLKYRPLFSSKVTEGEGADRYDRILLPDGSTRGISKAERSDPSLIPPDARRYQLDNLTSDEYRPDTTISFEYNGNFYHPGQTSHWKTTVLGLRNLALAQRLEATGRGSLRYRRMLDDFPAKQITNLWTDISGSVQSRSDPKVYVVQSSTALIQRCLLMATDPGDLILDPTCGSGTSAIVAEQWGRRWITIDTSRVALALARQRLMAAQLPAYILADSHEGRFKKPGSSGERPQHGNAAARDVRKGFSYQRVARIKLGSIANNTSLKEEMSLSVINEIVRRDAEVVSLLDKPYEDKAKIRVAGRFTVESLSPHRTVAPERKSGSEEAAEAATGGSSFEQTIIDNLRMSGVQNGRKKERLLFATLETHAGRYIQAFGDPRLGDDEAGPERIAVSIGPQYGTVDAEWVKEAAREALRGRGAEMLLVCAFAFDPQAVPAAKEFAPSDPNDFASVAAERKLGKLPILFVRMNSDLAMGDVLLKKTKAANLFMVFGEPDIEIRPASDNQIAVEIRGVDVYNPSTGEIRSSGTNEIALWMIDTEYTGDAFFVRHCYFTGGQDPYKRLKKSLQAEIDVDAWASLNSTRSRPFPRPDSGKIAVKVINHYGDEVLQVYDV